MSEASTLRLCVLIMVANFLDAWLTLWWIALGVATEKNPLLKELVDRPTSFLAIKMSVVAVGIMLLWNYREHRLARQGLMVSALTYSYILMHHLIGALQVFG